MAGVGVPFTPLDRGSCGNGVGGLPRGVAGTDGSSTGTVAEPARQDDTDEAGRRSDPATSPPTSVRVIIHACCASATIAPASSRFGIGKRWWV